MSRQRVRTYSRPKKKMKPAILLHRKLGFWAGIPLTGLAFLGSLLNFSSEFTKWLDPVPFTVLASKKVPLDWSERLQIVKKGLPDENAQLRSIHFNQGAEGVILFYFSDHARIYWDEGNARVLKVAYPGSHWIHWLYPVHSGRVWGGVGSMGVLAIGLLSLFILFYGFAGTLKSPFRRFS